MPDGHWTGINKKCDIHPYSMVLYELVTLKLPSHKAPSDQKTMVDAVMGNHPSPLESASECPLFLCYLIAACWDPDPEAHPSIINITLNIKSICLSDSVCPSLFVKHYYFLSLVPHRLPYYLGLYTLLLLCIPYLHCYC